MAEKITKIPNQNNIASIVAAHIKDTTETINIIVNSAVNSTVKYSSSTLDQLKTYSEVVTSLFSNNGAVITLIKAAETFQKFDGKKSSKESIKNGFETIKIMQGHIKDLFANISELKDIPEINLTGVVDIIKDIDTLRDSLDKEDKNLRPMWFRFWLLKHEISKTIDFITDISKFTIDTEKNIAVKALVSNIKIIYKDISEFLGSFENITTKQIKTFNKRWIKLKDLLSNVINYFSSYDVKTLNKINKLFSGDGLSMVFDSLSNIAENISKTASKLAVIYIFKNIIINGIAAIADISNYINEKFEKVKAYKTVIKTLKNIQDIVDKLVIISKNIIILGLIAAPALLASFLIISGLLPAIAITIVSIWMMSKIIMLVKPGILKGFKSLAAIIVSLLVIGAALIGFALLTPVFLKAIIWGVLVFVLASLALSLLIWGAFKIIGKLSISSIPSILAFGLTVGILIATILGAGLIILAAAKMAEYIEESVLKITLMIAGMLALTAALVALGIGITALSPFIVSSMVGFAQILAIIGLIIGIGLAINYLATVEVKSADAGEKTKEIILAVNGIREQLVNFGTKKEWKEDKKVLKQVRKVTKTLTKIADDLNKLQSITIDKDKIIANVTGIMKFTQTLEDLMNKLLFGGTIDDKENASNGNFVTRNLTKLLHKGAAKSMRKEMKQNKKVLNKVDKVIDKLVGIGEALVSISELKLTPEIKQLITDNIGSIFEFIRELDIKINEFLHTDEVNEKDVLDTKKMRNKEWRKNKKILSKVEATILSIQNIADTFTLLQDLKLTDGVEGTKAIIIKNVGILMSSIEEIASIINGKKENIKVKPRDIEKLQPLIDYINSLNTAFKDLAASNSDTVKNNVDNYIRLIDRITTIETTSFGSLASDMQKVHDSINKIDNLNPSNFEKNINNYVKFVDKVNSVEVKKLETSAKMFEQMAKFSKSIKGDFNQLAEALGDKLLPVLEELKEVMETIPNKLDQGFQNTSASIASTSAPATKENITAQINRENPNMTPEQIKKEVDNRIAEKSKADANGVAAKLDELIGLLKGFGGEHVLVQTV